MKDLLTGVNSQIIESGKGSSKAKKSNNPANRKKRTPSLIRAISTNTISTIKQQDFTYRCDFNSLFKRIAVILNELSLLEEINNLPEEIVHTSSNTIDITFNNGISLLIVIGVEYARVTVFDSKEDILHNEKKMH